MNSKKFQPKIVLKRLNVVQESKIYKINNPDALEEQNQRNLFGLGPITTLHKRQSVPPIRYNDYNVSIVDSDSELTEDDEDVISAPLKSVNTHKATYGENENQADPDKHICGICSKVFNSHKKVKEHVLSHKFTYGPASKKRLCESNKQKDIKNAEEESATESMNNTIFQQNADSSITDEQTGENQNQIPKTVIESEKHICGICTKVFSSRKEVEAHVLSHKTENSSQRFNKHKMMRCKRCHEIVEARLVKTHVCRSLRPVHKCYVCNSTFRTEKLLVRHLENHDQSEFKIEHITKTDCKKPFDENVPQTTEQLLNLEKSQKSDTNLETEQPETINPEKIQSEQTDIVQTEEKQETYTCFVCGKIFIDKDILKDHLQKHCEDLSEDEQSMGKEQFQCAICGESQESGDALEIHVEKHLYDDEDDNPDLINISSESDKSREDLYKCSQCAETFSSEMLLEMHMQAHEEEAAIAEWEKQGLKTYDNQCIICDETFETEEELSEHLDVHNGNAHVCQLCDKPFLTLEDLQKHVATH